MWCLWSANKNIFKVKDGALELAKNHKNCLKLLPLYHHSFNHQLLEVHCWIKASPWNAMMNSLELPASTDFLCMFLCTFIMYILRDGGLRIMPRPYCGRHWRTFIYGCQFSELYHVTIITSTIYLCSAMDVYQMMVLDQPMASVWFYFTVILHCSSS